MTREDPEGRPAIAPLRATLHAAASRHQPDRAAMLARIDAGRQPEAGRRHRAPKPRSRFRPGASVAAVTCGVAVIAVGAWAISKQNAASPISDVNPARPTAAASSATVRPTPRPTPSVSPRETPLGTQSPDRLLSSASSLPSVSSLPSASPVPSGVHTQESFLWSDGSVDPNSTDNWAQSNVTLKNHLTVTALTARLRIALTPGVANAGSWSTVPSDALTVTVTRQQDALVYEWVLKPGRTLAPGTYIFAGQYRHVAGGRDAGRDTYQATATARNIPVLVYGNFF